MMNTLKTRIPMLALAGFLVIAIAGTAQAGGNYKKDPKANVVTALKANGKFSTLVTAVNASGLVKTLKGPGPYTVFAPDDEAFAKLPKGALDELLKDKAKLKSVLLFHVVSGELMPSDLEQRFGPRHETDVDRNESLMTANGKELPVKVNPHTETYYVGQAKIIGPPIKTGNGIIYTISEVLMPPGQ